MSIDKIILGLTWLIMGVLFTLGIYCLSTPICIGMDTIEDRWFSLDESDGQIFAKPLTLIMRVTVSCLLYFVVASFYYIYIIGLLYVFKKEIQNLILRLKPELEIILEEQQYFDNKPK